MKRAAAIRKEHKAVCAEMDKLTREAAKAGYQQGPLPKDERLYFELYSIRITLEWVYPCLIKTRARDRINRGMELAGYRHYLAGPLHATLYP